MDVHELNPGDRAPDGSDYVTLNVLESGKIGFTGTRRMGDVDAHTVSPNSFATEDEALAAALEWGEETGIATLYVERPNA